MHATLSIDCNLWSGGEFDGPLPDISFSTLLNEYFTMYTLNVEKVVLDIKGPLQPGLILDFSSKFLRQSAERCVGVQGDEKKVTCPDVDGETPILRSRSSLEELVKVTRIVVVEVKVSLTLL